MGKPHVILQVGQLSESFATYLAGEWLLSSVNELMALKFGGRGELLSTVGTLVTTIVHSIAVGS